MKKQINLVLRVLFLLTFISCKQERKVSQEELAEVRHRAENILTKYGVQDHFQIEDTSIIAALSKGEAIPYDSLEATAKHLQAVLANRCDPDFHRNVVQPEFSKARNREEQIEVVKKYPQCFVLSDWGLDSWKFEKK